MKKFLTVFCMIFVLLCGITLGGCTDDKELTLTEDFAQYYEESNVSDSKYLHLKTSSGATLWNISFNKEENSAPKVIVDWEFDFSDKTTKDKDKYKFITQKPQAIKNEMKAIGDKVVQFAKARQWNNNYYLYITISIESFEFDFVYDYEKDKLYSPKQLPIVIEMYEKFSTFYQKDIANMQGGVDWLVANGLGEMKHGEYNSKLYGLQSYSVWISQGKFVSTATKLSNEY